MEGAPNGLGSAPFSPPHRGGAITLPRGFLLGSHTTVVLSFLIYVLCCNCFPPSCMNRPCPCGRRPCVRPCCGRAAHARVIAAGRRTCSIAAGTRVCGHAAAVRPGMRSCCCRPCVLVLSCMQRACMRSRMHAPAVCAFVPQSGAVPVRPPPVGVHVVSVRMTRGMDTHPHVPCCGRWRRGERRSIIDWSFPSFYKWSHGHVHQPSSTP